MRRRSATVTKSHCDIVDVYQYDNDSVAFAIADISGKGPYAAVNAALIKFGVRAYSSEGLTPERVIRALDRLYVETNAFEKRDSFASVFFGIVDSTRRFMNYTNAGHEPVLVISPSGVTSVLGRERDANDAARGPAGLSAGRSSAE